MCEDAFIDRHSDSGSTAGCATPPVLKLSTGGVLPEKLISA